MPTVTHKFVNPIADDPSFLGTKPSDWNDTHEVSFAAIDTTYADLLALSTTPSAPINILGWYDYNLFDTIFVADATGFTVGKTATITGTTTNDGTFVIAAIAESPALGAPAGTTAIRFVETAETQLWLNLGAVGSVTYVVGSMIPEQKYRITDFASLRPTTTGWGFCAVESLVVKAMSPNALHTEASSDLHPKDIIHYSFELYLSRNPNESVYVGTHFGSITYRWDQTDDISCSFDFRNYWSRVRETVIGSGKYTRYADPNGLIPFQYMPLFNVVGSRGIKIDSQDGSFVPMVFLGPVYKAVIGPQQDFIILNSDAQDIAIGSCSRVEIGGQCLNLTLSNSGTAFVRGTVLSLVVGAGATLQRSGSITNCQVMAGYQDIDFIAGDLTNELIGYPAHGIIDTTYADLIALSKIPSAPRSILGWYEYNMFDTIFVADATGFTIGKTATITGTTTNDGTFVIADIADGTIYGGAAGTYAMRFVETAETLLWVNAGAVGSVTYVVGSMIPEQQYRITDFQIAHDISGASPAEIHLGTIEPLTVRAKSPSELYPDAQSELFPRDIIRYVLNRAPSERSPLEIANAPEFKGWITHREDPDRNIISYHDWRNCVVRCQETIANPLIYKITYVGDPECSAVYHDLTLLPDVSNGSPHIDVFIDSQVGNSEFPRVVIRGGVQKLKIGTSIDPIIFNAGCGDVEIAACCSVQAYGWCNGVIAEGPTNVLSRGNMQGVTVGSYANLINDGDLTNVKVFKSFQGTLTGSHSNELIGYPNKAPGLLVFADNAAALVGGLLPNDEYRTATGVKMVVYTP